MSPLECPPYVLCDTVDDHPILAHDLSIYEVETTFLSIFAELCKRTGLDSHFYITVSNNICPVFLEIAT